MRYGIIKRLKKGITVSIFPTFRCNLDCEYCSNKFYDGNMPVSSEIKFYDWKKLIDNFPIKIREIVITGGEPMLYKDIDKLVMYLADEKKYCVTVYSNILIKRYILYSGDNFRIEASQHRGVSDEKFDNRLKWYRDIYNIRVDIKSFSKTNDTVFVKKGTMNLETPENNECMMSPRLVFSPDGKVFINKKHMLENMR